MNDQKVKTQLIDQSLTTKLALIDDNKVTWSLIEKEILENSDCIIAIRGAGSRNGSDKTEIDKVLMQELIPRLTELTSCGKRITILYDGDPDIPNKPDIGYVAGRLLDQFGNGGNIIFLAVQREKWYKPPAPGRNIINASGKDFVTYVFKQEVYKGEYSAFTQSDELVKSPKYEQWYIGASGKRADGQLREFNRQVPAGENRRVTFFRARVNENLEKEFAEELSKAKRDKDQRLIGIYSEILAYRKDNPYGAHWDNEGVFKNDLKSLKSLDINVATQFDD